MAATFGVVPSGVGSVHSEKIPGSFFDVLVTVTGDGAYPAGGYPFAVSQFQGIFGGAYSAIESVEVVNGWSATAGGGTSLFVAYYDRINKKVQAFGMNAAAGVGNPLTEATAGAITASFQCTLRVRFY